ncbi:MAG: amidohydrolase family protein [Acidimicrobiia bacterium]
MTDIVDIWVNIVTPKSAEQFLGQEGYESIPDYLGSDGTGGVAVDEVLRRMDANGVATGILTPGLIGDGVEQALAISDAHPGRFLVAIGVVQPHKPTKNAVRIREFAQHSRAAMVRVMPLATQVPINHPQHYPVYSVCEELGLPVAINAGIPGPQVRSRVQHPDLLEDVLIDFPRLTVVVAHMGHPYEELLMNYMRKWPQLYVSCTAYAPKYMDPNLVKFMNTNAYRGRVLWGSDDPWFPQARSLAEAKELPLDDDAMERFLGGTARALFDRSTA